MRESPGGLLDAGATVIATGRSHARLDDLTARLAAPRLVTATLDLLDPGLPARPGRYGNRLWGYTPVSGT